MKKPFLILSMFLVLSAWGGNMTVRPLENRKQIKDVARLDAKSGSQPCFADSDKTAGSTNKNGTLMIIAGAVVALGGAGALLLRRRK